MWFDFLKRWKKPAIAQDAGAQLENERDALAVLVELNQRLMRVAARDGLQNVVAGLGTSRDKRSFTGYAPVAPMQYSQAETYYRANWLAANIVDVRGTDMVREWYDVMWDGGDEDKNRETQLKELDDQFAIRERFWDATIWARLYGGAALVLGIKGEDPTMPLDVERLGKGCLEYVHAFDRWQLSPVDLMDKGPDLASPNFRQPRYFVLGGSEAEAGVAVHWTRVLTFHGRKLPYRAYLQNGMWGDSVLQHVIDDIKDYSSVMALLATMFFEANVDVMLIAGLAQTLSLPDGEAQVNSRFNIAAQQKSANRMLIMDAEDKYEKKGNNFTGLGAIVEDFRMHVCAAAQTPDTKLFGRSPGGLNATGEYDDQNYCASVVQAQRLLLTPQVQRGFRVFMRHLRGVEPAGFTITANPLRVETKRQKADREYVDAQRDAIYMAGDGQGNAPIGPHTIAKELKEKKVYKTLEDPEVAMVKSLEEAADEAHMQEAQKQAQLLAAAKTKAPVKGSPESR